MENTLMKRALQKETSGFTIIEMLVSISILVIILGSVYATFFTVNRAAERFDSVSLKYQETRTVLDIIRREIESSKFEGNFSKEATFTPFSFKDKDIFGKTASELTLTSFSFRGSGLNLISYFVKEEDGVLKLFKQESPALQESDGYSLEMINGIESFTVETLHEKNWVKVWDAQEAKKLPDMMRVTIEFDANGKTVSLREYAKPVVGFQL